MAHIKSYKLSTMEISRYFNNNMMVEKNGTLEDEGSVIFNLSLKLAENLVYNINQTHLY